jgi:phage terminase large subunit GpA-like protein
MQMDRLELEIVAWGVGEESWSIDYSSTLGDPGDEVWEELDDILEDTYMHESGAQLSISAGLIQVVRQVIHKGLMNM